MLKNLFRYIYVHIFIFLHYLKTSNFLEINKNKIYNMCYKNIFECICCLFTEMVTTMKIQNEKEEKMY